MNVNFYSWDLPCFINVFELNPGRYSGPILDFDSDGFLAIILDAL